jgi:MinD superfamily P-loop ATPase
MPLIDKEKCRGCGVCVSVCTIGGLEIVDKKVIATRADECDWCAVCELVCPNEAIRCPFEVVFEHKD